MCEVANQKNSLSVSSNRIDYIDIFRAFGIILMVMGHLHFGKIFDHFIHAFHMPMFFFVSGFLYKNNNISFWKFLCRKVRSFLIPYYVFGFMHLAYSLIMDGFSYARIEAIFLFPNNGKMPIAGALWFLMALFFVNIIYYWIVRIKNKRIVWIIVIAIVYTGQVAFAHFSIQLPFALNSAMVGVGLMHVGRTLRPFERHIIDLNLYQIVAFGLLTGISIMQSDYINMRTGTYSNVFIMFWVNAIAAIIIGMNLAKKMKTIFKDMSVNRYLQSVGRNSIIYVCLNQIVILFTTKILEKCFSFFDIHINCIIFNSGVNLAITLLVLFLLSILFEKTIFRVLIGKSSNNKAL